MKAAIRTMQQDMEALQKGVPVADLFFNFQTQSDASEAPLPTTAIGKPVTPIPAIPTASPITETPSAPPAPQKSPTPPEVPPVTSTPFSIKSLPSPHQNISQTLEYNADQLEELALEYLNNPSFDLGQVPPNYKNLIITKSEEIKKEAGD